MTERFDGRRHKAAGRFLGRRDSRFKKGGSSAPAAPDPAETARAQAAANKEAVYESARVNQINQVSPYGTVSYTGEIGSPERTQTLTLPPEVQKILAGQQAIGGQLTDFAQQFVPRVAEGLQNPFNTANVGVDRPVANEAERQRIEQALLGRLEPQFQRDEDRLRTRLANQGIAQGSEAFASAMDDMNRARTDARLATIGQAGNEYARDFGMQNQSYQQALSDALLNRTQGLNEVSALIQGAPAMQMPSAPSPGQYQMAAPDVIGASNLAYQGQLANYQAQQARSNAMLGGLAGLGGIALGTGLMPGGWLLGGAGGGLSGGAGMTTVLSDRRTKTGIKRVGTLDNGLPVYTFRYKSGGPVQMGVMAQDVEKVIPQAVIEHGGIKYVDYARVH